MTKPFDPNDRAAIIAALEDPDPDNPIAKEIAAKFDALTKVLEEACGKLGEMPETIRFAKPASALDEIVIALFHDALHDQRATLAALLQMDPAELLSLPEIKILDHGTQ